jgi:hypothetical protein
MIGRRVANIIKRFARHRDYIRLTEFERMSGFDVEWKFLRCPTETPRRFWGFGEPLATLHRYFIAANKMRIRFDNSLANTDGRIQ